MPERKVEGGQYLHDFLAYVGVSYDALNDLETAIIGHALGQVMFVVSLDNRVNEKYCFAPRDKTTLEYRTADYLTETLEEVSGFAAEIISDHSHICPNTGCEFVRLACDFISRTPFEELQPIELNRLVGAVAKASKVRDTD